MHTPHTYGPLRLFVMAAALFSCYGGLHSASGQVPNLTPAQRPDTSPNPQTYSKHFAGRRPGNRPRTTPGKPAPSPRGTGTEDKQEAIEQAIEDGNTARDRNEYEQAIVSYQRAQELSPREARAFYGIGNVYADLYCHDSAIEAYRKSLDLKKDYVEALIGLGYAYAGKERYDEAERQFRKALELKQGSADANIGLARIFMMQGKYEEAVSQTNLVINDKSAQDKDRASARVALGGTYWKQEKRQDAVAQFEEAIRLKPDLAGAYVELGNARAYIAYSKLPAFTSVSEINMQELEALRAAERQAASALEDARNHHYNHPNLHEYMALALAYQFRYEDAFGQLDEYLVEVNKLETQMSSGAAKCGSGFARLKADGYRYKGFVYFLQGRFEADPKRRDELVDKAVAQFNEAVSMKQDYAEAYNDIGNMYALQRKHEAAAVYFNKAILYSTEESAKAGIYMSLALAYSSSGHHAEAVGSMEEAVRRDPKNPSMYEGLASVYVSQNRLEETITQLKKASELRAELKTDEGANPSPYYYLGCFYIIRFIQKGNEEDFKEAVKVLGEAVKIRPRYALAYQALGTAYEKHGNADEALANYKKAAECDPKDPRYVSDMADVYFFIKNNDDAAIGLHKQALSLKPDYAMSYWKLGVIYFHKKDYAEAVKQLLDAIKYDPKFLQAYLDVATIYRLQKDYAAAVKYLMDAIAIEPTSAVAYRQMGMVYQERADADGALANFQRAVEYEPQNPVNYTNMAAVYSELRHDDEAAVKQLLKAIQVDPKYVDAYSSLAEIYKRRKDYAEAARQLTTAISIAPSVPWTYKDLAKVYEADGKNEDAIHNYEEALKRLGASELSAKNLYLGRIERLRGRYTEAIAYFQKVSFPEGPAQTIYEVGVVYVASKNKKAALEQHQQLVQLKSPLAEDLLAKINEMK